MRLKTTWLGFLLTLPLMFNGVAAGEVVESKEPVDCFGYLRHALVEGGYSGSLDCQSLKLTIRKVGSIATSSKSYSIYDLRYKTIPVADLVSHGGQKILVLKDDKTYLGQYSLSPPPMHTMHIRGVNIYLDVSKKLGNRISFENGIPPDTAYIDGEVIKLSK